MSKTKLLQKAQPNRPIKIDQINYFLLKVFETTLRTRSITGTANELDVSQPAISKAMSKLREIFDDYLFIRQNSTLTLTEKAKLLSDDIIHVLKVLDGMTESRAFDPHIDTRHFKIGIVPIMKNAAYGKILNAFKDYSVSLDFIEIDYTYPENASSSPDFDIMLGLTKEPGNLRTQLLIEDEFIVLGRKNHPLLMNEAFTLKDYLSAKHIQVKDIPNDLDEFGLGKRDVKMKVDMFQDVFNLLKNSDYLLTIGIELASIHIKHLHEFWSYRTLPTKVAPKVSYYAAWSPVRDNIISDRWLRDILFSIEYDGHLRDQIK
ncbi:MAG: LysR family transcriptional regulator [Francisellaceae bacterium]